jgi:hypothetical protein
MLPSMSLLLITARSWIVSCQCPGHLWTLLSTLKHPPATAPAPKAPANVLKFKWTLATSMPLESAKLTPPARVSARAAGLWPRDRATTCQQNLQVEFRDSRTQTKLYVFIFRDRPHAIRRRDKRPLHQECGLPSGGSDDLPRLRPCTVRVLITVLNSKRPNEKKSEEV